MEVTIRTAHDYLVAWLAREYVQIPFYKPNGKQIYFDRIELEAWMKQNRVATQQETGQKAVNYVVTGKQKGGRL